VRVATGVEARWTVRIDGGPTWGRMRDGRRHWSRLRHFTRNGSNRVGGSNRLQVCSRATTDKQGGSKRERPATTNLQH